MITYERRQSNVTCAGPYWLVKCDTASEEEQLAVLLEALRIFGERNAVYDDNWKRQGWRGSLFKLRLKVERAWDVLWTSTPVPEDLQGGEFAIPIDVDDLLDAINCAAFAVRQVRAGDRDGQWEYPS